MNFFLKFPSVTLYESLISKYKISWVTVKTPQWAVTRTVPSGPFRVVPVFLRGSLRYDKS
jgi:hypothetical protein